MIDCDGESLVSSGVDHLVIVWQVRITHVTHSNETVEIRTKRGGILWARECSCETSIVLQFN